MEPSHMLGTAVMGGLVLFALYFLARGMRGVNFNAFLHGIAWLILLAFVGCVLIVVFQVGYPGH